MKAEPGIRIGFRLQCLVAAGGGDAKGPIRGASDSIVSKTEDEKDGNAGNNDSHFNIQSGPVALNYAVYRILQTNRKHRRSLIHNLLVLFDLEQVIIQCFRNLS